MYKYLKQTLELAERLGSVKTVRVDDKNTVYGDRICVSGTSETGSEFVIEVSVREKKDANS